MVVWTLDEVGYIDTDTCHASSRHWFGQLVPIPSYCVTIWESQVDYFDLSYRSIPRQTMSEIGNTIGGSIGI